MWWPDRCTPQRLLERSLRRRTDITRHSWTISKGVVGKRLLEYWNEGDTKQFLLHFLAFKLSFLARVHSSRSLSSSLSKPLTPLREVEGKGNTPPTNTALPSQRLTDGLRRVLNRNAAQVNSGRHTDSFLSEEKLAFSFKKRKTSLVVTRKLLAGGARPLLVEVKSPLSSLR
jgi:hypothetical protein